MRLIASYFAFILTLAAGCGTPPITPDDGGTDGSPPMGCTDDTQCGGATPRCDKNSSKCVACLPLDDTCPKGKRCVVQGGVPMCASSCVSAMDCPSSDGGALPACCNSTIRIGFVG